MRKSMAVVAVLSGLIGGVVGHAHGQASQPAPEKFVLSGVISVDGAPGLAWLQEPNLTGNRPVVLRAGESIGPYRLTKVLEDRVELEGPAGKVLVPLRNAQGAPAAVASVAPAPFGSQHVAAAPAVSPAVNPGGEPDAAAVWGQRLESLRREYEQREIQAATAAQGQTTAQGRETQWQAAQQSTGQAHPSQPGFASPSAAKPTTVSPSVGDGNVIVLPVGDPRRQQSFQSMIGVK